MNIKVRVINPVESSAICRVFSEVPLVFHKVHRNENNMFKKKKFTYFSAKFVFSV